MVPAMELVASVELVAETRSMAADRIQTIFRSWKQSSSVNANSAVLIFGVFSGSLIRPFTDPSCQRSAISFRRKIFYRLIADR